MNGCSERGRREEAEANIAGAELVINKYQDDVNTTLRRFSRRTAYEATRTPLDEIFASEGAPKCPHCKKPIESDHTLEEWWDVRNETIRRFAQFCAQDGLEPYKVMRNVYACFAHMGLSPWTELTVRENGVILGESHGSSHYRMQTMCVNLLRRAGARSVLAPGQKGNTAAAEAAKAQKGNKNRKRQIRSRHRRYKKRKAKIK